MIDVNNGINRKYSFFLYFYLHFCTLRQNVTRDITWSLACETEIKFVEISLSLNVPCVLGACHPWHYLTCDQNPKESRHFTANWACEYLMLWFSSLLLFEVKCKKMVMYCILCDLHKICSQASAGLVLPLSRPIAFCGSTTAGTYPKP